MENQDQNSEEYIKYFTQLPDGWVIDPETNMACPIQETREYIRIFSTPPEDWDKETINDGIAELKSAFSLGMTLKQYRNYQDRKDDFINLNWRT